MEFCIRHKLHVSFLAAVGVFPLGAIHAQSADSLRPFTLDHRKAFESRSPIDLSFLLEAPAGKHGFIRVSHGHFVTGDGKRIRFWGVNVTDWSKGSVMVPSKEDAPLWAATLARFGVNCVRLQFLDLPTPRGLIDGKRDDTRAFEPEQLDREDFFIAELKKKGIYVDLNLLVGRPFQKGDGVQDANEIREGAKGISLFDPRLIDSQKGYAQQLLTHYNPYTKSEYRGEPAIAIVEINNENALGIGAHGPTAYYDHELADLYNQWLENNLSADDLSKLRALAQVGEHDPVPLLQGKPEIEAAPKERFYAESRFFLDVERRYFDGMREYLTSTLGVKSLIIATADHSHSGSGYPLLLATSSFATTDGHDYWQPPWLNKVKTPMVNDPGNSTVVELSRSAVREKPYTVSEVNHPFPSAWGAEGIPILAAYGGFQDWDGIFWYTFEPKAARDWKAYIGDPFDISLDPVKMAEIAAGALCFLRADVKPARKTVERSYTHDQVFDSARLPERERPYFTPGFPPLLPLEHGSRIGALEGAQTESFSLFKAADPAISDTHQLAWYRSLEKKGLVTINTPRSQALVGFVAAHSVSLSNLSVELDNEFSAIIVASLEPQPISHSSRLLLVTAGRVENEGMSWNEAHSDLSTWGTTPTLIDTVSGRVTLRGLSRVKAVVVQPIDGSGQPLGEAACASKTNRGWEFPLGAAATVWYEVSVTR